MADLSLQERLIRYLKAQPHKRIAKGTLCDLAREKMGVTGESVGRRLRVFHEASHMTMEECEERGIEHKQAKELLEGGTLEVEYREQNHAFYYYVPPATRKVWRVRIEGDRAIGYYETITT